MGRGPLTLETGGESSLIPLSLGSSLFLDFVLFVVALHSHPGNLEKCYLGDPRTGFPLPLIPKTRRRDGKKERIQTSVPLALPLLLMPHPKFSPSPPP